MCDFQNADVQSYLDTGLMMLISSFVMKSLTLIQLVKNGQTPFSMPVKITYQTNELLSGLDQLSILDVNKPNGLDEIPPRLLKAAAREITPSLAKLLILA